MKAFGMAILATGVFASGAMAQVWAEQGDAGDVAGTAQTAVGVGSLTSITGATAVGDMVDMYLIQINEPTSFQASTTPVNGGAATFDTQLFLFDANGFGVQSNDDGIPSVNFSSTLGGPTNLGDGGGITTMAPGQYLLAITGFDTEPNSGGSPIFPNAGGSFTQQVGANNGSGAVTGWGPAGATGVYTIALTGAKFVPGPASLALLGLAGLAARRRRA